MKLIEGETCVRVWVEAVQYLKTVHNEDCDVILKINEPIRLPNSDEVIVQKVDSFLEEHGKWNTHTVAETLFPSHEYRLHNAEGVYEVYPEKYSAIKPCKREIDWGTYAYRLVRRQCHGGEFNPLKDLVDKIAKTQTEYHSCYELGLDIPIYDPETDRRRYRGGPCLSHISVKVVNGKINLTAIYRYHYYIQKLLGNLIGLARLQSFIANESGKDIGELIVHSSFAKLDLEGWGLKDVEHLLEPCLTDS